MFFPRTKFWLAAGWVFLFFIVVIVRLVALQLVRGKEYERSSNSVATRELLVPAPRGMIYDRKGVILATTQPSFDLIFPRENLKQIRAILPELAPILRENPEVLLEVLNSAQKLPKFKPVLLKAQLNLEQIAQIKSIKALRFGRASGQEGWNALDVQMSPVRHYQGGEPFGSLIGYLREISDKQLEYYAQFPESYPYKAGDLLGAQGVERSLDLQLRGKEGKEVVWVDAVGRILKSHALTAEEPLPPERGDNLYLTIDGELQKTAYQALAGKVGAVAVLDSRTGEVLALVSRPSYDSEQLSAGFSNEYWQKLVQNEHKPFLNRTFQAAYPPGSTYKIITAVAVLAEKIVTPTDTIVCPGYYNYGGRKFGCWNSHGHGSVDLYRALVESCDVYFYRLGEKLGVDRLAMYAHRLGLGQRTGIELSASESKGLVPSTEWKKKKTGQDWNPGETLSVAIGQGANLVTPLQNALMVARVASSGKPIIPRLIQRIERSDGTWEASSFPESQAASQIPLTTRDWNVIHRALKGVVNSGGGTAHHIALKEVSISGKTGTAQVVNYDTHGRKATSRKTEDHAWFVAYAPSDNPEIAIAVIVEHGGHGGAAAAPVAQRVIQKYFDLYGYPQERNKKKEDEVSSEPTPLKDEDKKNKLKKEVLDKKLKEKVKEERSAKPKKSIEKKEDLNKKTEKKAVGNVNKKQYNLNKKEVLDPLF